MWFSVWTKEGELSPQIFCLLKKTQNTLFIWTWTESHLFLYLSTFCSTQNRWRDEAIWKSRSLSWMCQKGLLHLLLALDLSLSLFHACFLISLTSRRLFLFDTQPYLRRRLVQGCWICRYFYYSPCIHERFWLNCEMLFWYKFSWLFLTPGETLLWDPESVRMWPPSTFACLSLTLVVFSSCWPFFKLKLYSLLEHIVDFFLWYIGKEAKTSLLQMVSFTKMTISLGKFCLFSRNSRI